MINDNKKVCIGQKKLALVATTENHLHTLKQTNTDGAL